MRKGAESDKGGVLRKVAESDDSGDSGRFLPFSVAESWCSGPGPDYPREEEFLTFWTTAGRGIPDVLDHPRVHQEQVLDHPRVHQEQVLDHPRDCLS